ncbi:hypothetical protein GCM10007870_27890 [Gluconobacter kondonii]|uniref:Acetyltransferase n=3 Tax=Gluconobacter kondonii TaxID=941463 RepID=A0ABQ5WUW2_9PROT|nr:hypothetical protein AA3266_1981 [Gluconobacter kondonii NBRC 3266]GLQ67204.1 hypothetical protein GCM10007870_27890 [Gluconobacter kondonii]
MAMYSTLITSSKSLLHVSEGVLGHASPTEVVDPVYAWRAEANSDVIYLMAASGEPFWIMGDFGQRAIFSFKIRRQVGGGIAIEHPSNAKIFRASDDGRIYIDGENGGLDKIFFEESINISPNEIRIKYQKILSNTLENNLISLSKMSPFVEMADMAYAITRLESFSSYSHVIDQIKELPSYEFIFPSIQLLMKSEFAGSGRNFHAHYAWGGGDFVDVGKYSYGFPRILPYPPARLKVSAFCSIAEDVTVVLGNHLTKAATTFPFQDEAFRWPSRHADIGKFEDSISSGVVIGNDVWIGRGVTILPGAVIGDGCIVGAESVVRGKVEPYSIYLGNPGYVLKPRFDAQTTSRLLALKWWEWPEWKIDRYCGMMMTDLQGFLDKAEKI